MTARFQYKFAIVLIGISLASILAARDRDSSFWLSISIVLGMSVVGYLLTVKMIPKIIPYMLKADIYGLDINKKGTPEGQVKIPQSLGLVSAMIFIVISFASILIFKVLVPVPQQELTMKFAALVCIVLSILLGFTDDVLDIPWRYKLIVPLFGIIPVLIAYDGVTFVLLPNILRPILGATINLGILYFVYMAMLGIFCTNAINILAGINGLQVGQSIVIAASIILHNSIQLYLFPENEVLVSHHIFSIFMLLPLLGVSLGLFKYNSYPSKVFVGDTYCYFSGMVFATTGILGHFSKTLLLMFIPQIINFLISLPQLFGLIPCPRHRLPRYNQTTRKLEAIPTNWNFVNLVLYFLGPTTEERLCDYILILQAACSVFALFCRYYVARTLWT